MGPSGCQSYPTGSPRSDAKQVYGSRSHTPMGVEGVEGMSHNSVSKVNEHQNSFQLLTPG